jgi:ABC-2 type transport system permease protein
LAIRETLRNITAQTRRELNAAFLTPLAYVVLTLFLFFTGFAFYLVADATREASLTGVVSVMAFLFLIATPLLTMRLLSEEYRGGTIESLMTAPVTEAQIIMGKYLGALGFYLFMLLPTLIYVAVLEALGEPDYGLISASYLGLLLMGAQYIAVGLFCSSLTGNQIVAGVMALVLLLAFWLMSTLAGGSGTALSSALQYAGSAGHLRPFWLGRVAFRDVLYFLSTTAFWLFLSVRVLESKRWR